MTALNAKMKQNRATLVFIAGFVLAGVIHVFDRVLNSVLLGTTAEGSAYAAFGSTLLFTLNLAIYMLLLVWWLISVYTRLLPSRGRTYIVVAAVFMILFLLIRSFKYRLADFGAYFEHYLWYAYYVPLAVIPASFLLTSLCVEPDRKGGSVFEKIVIAVTVLLVAGVATNDLHKLMFRPILDAVQGGSWGSYTTGPLWYCFYGFMIICVVLGIVLMVTADRRLHRGRRMLLPIFMLFGMLVMMVLMDRIVTKYLIPMPWSFPDAAVFCMLGIFESCIRCRLIPNNENYAGFFKNIKLPAVITDTDLNAVYRTASPVNATAEQYAAAMETPRETADALLLYGRRLSSGCAFWISDESVMRRLNDELTDVAETLETENDLLRFENEQKEERARVDARNRVYAKAAAEVYDTQKKISALIEKAVPGTPEYPACLGRILSLNAYVKRKTNFVLLASERDTVSAEELFLALEESARFLTLRGTEARAERKTDRDFRNAEAMALYDGFEAVAEALPADASGLMITLTDDSLRILADCSELAGFEATNARISSVVEDGQLFVTVTAGEADAV